MHDNCGYGLCYIKLIICETSTGYGFFQTSIMGLVYCDEESFWVIFPSCLICITLHLLYTYNPIAVAIDFKEASILVTEGVDSNATICLLFSQGSLGREIDFLISIQEGTATSDDFVNGVLYTVTFSSGQMAPTEHCIVLQLIDDNIVESVESFSALLSTTDPGVALSTSTTTVTLFDDPNDGKSPSLTC